MSLCTFPLSLSPQGATSSGAKRQKVESWEKSVGGLGGKSALGSLVVRKKPAATVTAPQPAAGTQTGIGRVTETFDLKLFVVYRNG